MISVASFILGICSLVGLPLLKAGSLFAAVLALILGIIGKKKEEKSLYANIGLILGIITLIIMIIGLVFGFLAIQHMKEWLQMRQN